MFENPLILVANMSITVLKSNPYLPISKVIEPFFSEESSQYFYNPFTTVKPNKETCVYDNGFALINSIEITVPSETLLSNLLIKSEQDEFAEVQYTEKFNDNGQENRFVWKLSKVVRRIELVDSDVLREIKKIKIIGRTISNLQQIFDKLDREFDELNDDWENTSTVIKSTELENKKLQAKNIEISNTINILELKATNLRQFLEHKEVEQEELEDKEKQLRFNLQHLSDNINSENEKFVEAKEATEKIHKINQTISDETDNLTKELERLELEKYKYSEDFDAFKRELSSQNGLFLSLIIVFVVIGGSIAYNLVQGSYDLLRSFNSGVNIYELIISRVPSVLIHSLIIFFLSKWIGVIIDSLVDNLNDIKRLKQLVYLVTEVTESQAVGLPEHGLPRERYKERVTQKMSIIREALRLNTERGQIKEVNTPFEKVSQIASDTIRVVSGK
ncbi:hypothetical protein BH581_23365 [Vibrio splendidus]|uniref:hypothetical protein n=1 Tax=Vibrio splendidus TaxID=29497 RepID=UPI000977A220|nr:hypothetical protein [Vibrio splendidus]OMO19856.1 hypothetical protein BH581_23365 [Vibrio splendidus]